MNTDLNPVGLNFETMCEFLEVLTNNFTEENIRLEQQW